MRQMSRVTLAIAVSLSLAVPALAASTPADLSHWTPYGQPVPGLAGAAPGEWVSNAPGPS